MNTRNFRNIAKLYIQWRKNHDCVSLNSKPKKECRCFVKLIITSDMCEFLESQKLTLHYYFYSIKMTF